MHAFAGDNHMKLNLRKTTQSGEFTRSVQIGIGIIAIVLAFLLWLSVRTHLPSTASNGHLALTALVIAAIPGYFSLLSILLKAYQGGKVDPAAEE
jgi:hypothetical protein